MKKRASERRRFVDSEQTVPGLLIHGNVNRTRVGRVAGPGLTQRERDLLLLAEGNNEGLPRRAGDIRRPVVKINNWRKQNAILR